MPAFLEGFSHSNSYFYAFEDTNAHTLDDWRAHQPENRLAPRAALLPTIQVLEALQTLQEVSPPPAQHVFSPALIAVSAEGATQISALSLFGRNDAAGPTDKGRPARLAFSFRPARGADTPYDDLAAAGATLYTLLTGADPLGMASADELLAKLRDVRPELSPEVIAATMQLLGIGPDEPFTSAADASAALHAALGPQTCRLCGFVNSATTQFCANCGTELLNAMPLVALKAALEPSPAQPLNPIKIEQPQVHSVPPARVTSPRRFRASGRAGMILIAGLAALVVVCLGFQKVWTSVGAFSSTAIPTQAATFPATATEPPADTPTEAPEATTQQATLAIADQPTLTAIAFSPSPELAPTMPKPGAGDPPPRPTASPEPPPTKPKPRPTRPPATATPSTKLRFIVLNYNDTPTCISVQIRGIKPIGWSFSVDGITTLPGIFDKAGNARLCGLASGQEVTITVFRAGNAPVRGGAGIPSRGGAIMVADWR